MKRRLDKAERALWRAVTRDVVRLPSAPPDMPLVTAGIPPAAPVVAPLPAPRSAPKPLPSLPTVFDAAVDRRIQSGRTRVEARLDLHGMTEDAAYRALVDFTARCAAAHVGLGLVVTGKGRSGNGILRQNLPRWLDAPPLRGMIRAVQPAGERHGGAGAFYILFVRRPKTPTTSPR